jgi:hypothetical protein
LLETQAQIDCLIASEPELTPAPSFATSDLEIRLATMEQKYAAAMQRVEALEVSTVWRASLPLRNLVDGVRRARAKLSRPAR